jgi:hypothetical protein
MLDAAGRKPAALSYVQLARIAAARRADMPA